MYGAHTEYIEQEIGYSGSQWSSWSTRCTPGTAVCTLKTRVEERQRVDNGALTDAQLHCCDY